MIMRGVHKWKTFPPRVWPGRLIMGRLLRRGGLADKSMGTIVVLPRFLYDIRGPTAQVERLALLLVCFKLVKSMSKGFGTSNFVGW